jgi:hypothetical protein
MNKLLTTITLLCFSVFANADPITYICAYPTWSDEDGNHPANDFNLTFIVDSENETAYMLGNLGTSEIIFLPKITGTNFLEMSDTGNIYTTTIDDNLNSVHSRNSVILGQLLASQYYGGCTVME